MGKNVHLSYREFRMRDQGVAQENRNWVGQAVLAGRVRAKKGGRKSEAKVSRSETYHF
jgi:hypothetical protein